LRQKRITIALLFGGRSAEHEVSLASAAAVYRNIDPAKFRVVCVYITRDGRWKETPSPLLPRRKMSEGRAYSFLPWKIKKRAGLSADIYFPVLHGPYGEDGTIQGLLEMADVPYVGAGVLASAAGMDKAVMKELFSGRGLPIVSHLTFLDTEWRRDPGSALDRVGRELAYPIFIKPANLGSSVGVSKVKRPEETSRAIRRAFRYDRKIVVEQGVTGRELECSVLGNDHPRASLPGEVFPFRDFYDYRDKYLDGKTKFGIPADLPSDKVDEVRKLAVEAYRAVQCTGMARMDFFLEEKSGSIYVNEINTIPGFTEISMYPKLWEVSGLPFPRLVEELVRLGFERHRRKKRCYERSDR
jgi:D-alanine-D-alanine ligase